MKKRRTFKTGETKSRVVFVTALSPVQNLPPPPTRETGRGLLPCRWTSWEGCGKGWLSLPALLPVLSVSLCPERLCTHVDSTWWSTGVTRPKPLLFSSTSAPVGRWTDVQQTSSGPAGRTSGWCFSAKLSTRPNFPTKRRHACSVRGDMSVSVSLSGRSRTFFPDHFSRFSLSCLCWEFKRTGRQGSVDILPDVALFHLGFLWSCLTYQWVMLLWLARALIMRPSHVHVVAGRWSTGIWQAVCTHILPVYKMNIVILPHSYNTPSSTLLSLWSRPWGPCLAPNQYSTVIHKI